MSRDIDTPSIAFRSSDGVGAPNPPTFAAQYPARIFPCQRFACSLMAARAWLGANVDRFSFIVETFAPYISPVLVDVDAPEVRLVASPRADTCCPLHMCDCRRHLNVSTKDRRAPHRGMLSIVP